LGLNDEKEKLDYAWTQMYEAEFDSEPYVAAYDHIYHVKAHDYEELRKLFELDWQRLKASVDQKDSENTDPPE
jgi:hypothetical protein